MNKPLALAASALVFAAASVAVAGSSGTNLRVAVSVTGAPADGESWVAGISADGRFVAFTSRADNLVPDDANGQVDAFVRDLQYGQIERVSVAEGGKQGNLDSAANSISAAGRYVVFDSAASNLVEGDLNDKRDVFVRDRLRGKTTLVSVSSRGRQGNGDSSSGVISANGRYVAFVSGATTLVPRDSNQAADVFVRDLKTSNTFRVDVGPLSRQARRGSVSGSPAISANGRYVAFASTAPNLVEHDTNHVSDVFVRDLLTARTTRVSVTSSGKQVRNASSSPSLSAGGRYVVFVSAAANLVKRDTNHRPDIFGRDRIRRKTTILSVSSAGAQSDAESRDPRISPDGRFVAFTSWATTLVAGTSGRGELYVCDVGGGQTVLASLGADGAEGDDTSGPAAGFDAAGHYLAFSSHARNLVSGETAGEEAYVREFGP